MADAAAAARREGDESAARRWSAVAAELLEPAREVALHGQTGVPQGPEGRAWLARAEAECAWAATGPDAAAWEKAVPAFGYGDAYELAALPAAVRAGPARGRTGVRRPPPRRGAARETAARLGAGPLLERADALIRRGRLADGPAAARDRPAR